MQQRRTVVAVVFDGLQPLDVVGPLEVLHRATQQLTEAGRPGAGYDVVLASLDGAPVTSDSGLTLGVHRSLRSIVADDTPVDTLLIAGGYGVQQEAQRPEMLAAVTALADRARRVAGVCSGAFILGAAGLLDGHRAVTHWSRCDLLADLFPDVDVDPDPIFIRDGKIWTSAGVTAGMDLTLALVEDDHGVTVAHETASFLVMFTRRPGGQSQFSAAMRSSWAERPRIRELQGWMADHLDEDLTVQRLAERAGMSERNFARVFRAECGTTPGEYVEALRLEAAKQLLERSDLSVETIARRVGLSGAAILHRLFQRRLGVTPGTYRRHFSAALT